MRLPKRFPGREAVAAVRAEADRLDAGGEGSETRRLAGRIQLLVRPDELGGVDLDLGDVVGVEGVAAKSRRGEPSLAVRKLELLAKIRAPLPDTFHGLTDVE